MLRRFFMKKQIISFMIILALILTLSLAVSADTVFIEAESGVMDSANPMNIGSDSNAFGGQYIYGDQIG